MTLPRSLAPVVALFLTVAVLVAPSTAQALSELPPTQEPTAVDRAPLWHKGRKVGVAQAYETGSDTHIRFSNVYAKFTAPKAGLTWKARVIASYSCATDVDPATGVSPVFTYFKEATPWTTTKLAGTTGILKAKGFERTCADGTVLYGPLKVRMQVSQPSGLAYALSTISAAG